VLTQVAGTQVCPSDDVDRAWHMHITRTADYERFCAGTLAHVPRRDGARHDGARAVTLARYHAVFGVEAPPSIWPPGGASPTPVPRPRVIRLTGVLARPSGQLAAYAASGIAAGVGAGLLGAFSRVDAQAAYDIGGIGLAVLCGAWVASWAATWRGGRTDPRDALDPYETAWMAGGARRVAATALGMLAQRGVLTLRVQRRRWKAPMAFLELTASPPRHVGEHPAERACRAGDLPGPVPFDEACARVARWSSTTGHRLAQAGLAVGTDTLDPARTVLLAIAWGLLVAATGCAVHGVPYGRFDGGFVLLAVGAVALAARTLLWMSRLTPRGRSVLDKVGERERRRSSSTAGLDAARLTWLLALEGAVAMMKEPRFDGIEYALGHEGVPNDD